MFFCSGIGIKLTGSANYFEGVHAFTGAADQYPLGAVYVPAEGKSDNTAGGEAPAGMHGNRFVSRGSDLPSRVISGWGLRGCLR